MEEFYIKNSVPLVQADNLALGEEYFTREGHCYRYVGGVDGKQFEFVNQTPLMSGELLPEIAGKEHVLKMFWALSKSMR